MTTEEQLKATGQIKHGMEGTPEYQTWSGIKTRCYNPRDKSYQGYGSRGIVMSDEWLRSFPAFLRDMGRRPGLGFTIDRINNDGPYCKDNCRWATVREQTWNRRTSRMLTANGKRQCVAAWSVETGIPAATIRYRVNHGWPEEKAVFTPIRNRR